MSQSNTQSSFVRSRLPVLGAFCLALVALGGSVHADGAIARDQKVFEQNLGSNPVLAVISFYSSPGGNGGHYRLRNTTTQTRKYRIEVILQDGTPVRRIHHVQPGRSLSATFTAAGVNRTGIRRVNLLYAKPE